MSKRPTIKAGDIVRFSKRAPYGNKNNAVMVVMSVCGDGGEGDAAVSCKIYRNGIYSGRSIIDRKDLWLTGSSVKNMSGNNTITQKIYRDELHVKKALPKNNDGMGYCASCNMPTKFVQGFGSSGYNICKNIKCSMYDK